MALMMLIPAGAIFAAGKTVKPSFAVQVSPASQSVVRGSTASYTVTISSVAGFAGTVALTADGLPSASASSFTASSVSLAAGGTASSTLAVTTSGSTPVDTYGIKVQGTSGKTSASTTAGLTVNHALSGSFSLASSPSSLTLAPGSSGVYSVSITRSGVPGPISLSISGGLPSGATAAFSPNPVSGDSATVQISVSPTATSGKTTLYLVGSGKDEAGRTQNASASVQLEIDTKAPKDFTISGDVGSLAPGLSRAIDLSISNPNQRPISVSNLSVMVSDVQRTATAVEAGLPCSAADYAVVQYRGPYPLSVAPGSGSLSGLGVPSSQWPEIRMLDTRVNQDGCKGAVLRLSFSGSGQGN
jgi:uncharacterized membrane protein